MRLPRQTRRRLALCAAALRLVTVAHMAVVAHTADAMGQLGGAAFGIQQHLDAAMHGGTHAHAAAPEPARQGEESCPIASLLLGTDDGRVSDTSLVAQVVRDVPPPEVPADREGSRWCRLLAAPKASPPPFAEA